MPEIVLPFLHNDDVVVSTALLASTCNTEKLISLEDNVESIFSTRLLSLQAINKTTVVNIDKNLLIMILLFNVNNYSLILIFIRFNLLYSKGINSEEPASLKFSTVMFISIASS